MENQSAPGLLGCPNAVMRLGKELPVGAQPAQATPAQGQATGLITDAQAKPLLVDWIETFWNTRDESQARTIVAKCVHPSAVLHGFAMPHTSGIVGEGQDDQVQGRDGPHAPRNATIGIEAIIAYWREVKTAFPNLQVTLKKSTALVTGRRYNSRYIVRGTHTGPGLGLGQPTGKSFQVGGICLHKFGKRGSGAESLLVKEWNYSDDLSLLLQLGLAGQAMASPMTASAGRVGARE